MFSLLDPDRIRVAVAALLGAVVYGVFTLVTLFMTGAHVSRLDLFRAALNVVAAVVCGVIVAVVLAPWLTLWIPIVSMRDPVPVSFFIGALAWEVLPFVFLAARNRAKREADKQGGL